MIITRNFNFECCQFVRRSNQGLVVFQVKMEHLLRFPTKKCKILSQNCCLIAILTEFDFTSAFRMVCIILYGYAAYILMGLFKGMRPCMCILLCRKTTTRACFAQVALIFRIYLTVLIYLTMTWACRLAEQTTLLSILAVYCQNIIIQHNIKCFTPPFILDRVPWYGFDPFISLCLCICLRHFVCFYHAGLHNTLFTSMRTTCFISPSAHVTYTFR